MKDSGFRRWLAFGTGVGLELGANDLRVAIVRVRPKGTDLIGTTAIVRYRERHAAEWGAEYADFLKRHGAARLAAAVLLPRREAILRQLSLAGVPNRELGAAVGFQIDSLHPYPEGEAVWTWSRLAQGGAVLVGITRRSAVERYSAMFAEAGVRVASFTLSGAAFYAALRLLRTPPEEGFLALGEAEGGLEVYGESPARPVFSATLELPWERAASLAAAELRLPPAAEPAHLAAVLPAPAEASLGQHLLAYAAALAGACPWRAAPLNLLPAEQRSSSSRAVLIPTAALASLLLVVVAAWAAISPLENRRYLAALESEIARLEPEARRAATLDRAIDAARGRAALLDGVWRRSQAGLDALAELTRLLAPPVWLNNLELTANSVVLNGEAEQAGQLLKLIDGSPLFQNSEFTIPLARTGKNEVFRVRAGREGVSQ